MNFLIKKMKNKKIDIRVLNKEELEAFFISHNRPKFRANQVYQWLWKHHQLDFSQMSNLSFSDRRLLSEYCVVNNLEIVEKNTSTDGTVKFLFKLNETNVVEGVLIPHLNRLTACISSQAGCSLACKFCATGTLSLYRNLTAGEIYDQIYLINKHCFEIFNKPITNIVYMGMGEPLLNMGQVVKSISHIISENGMGMSPKRITVSTAGIAKMIKRLADINPKCNLAISLHAANNQKRTQIMEINNSNNLEMLAESLKYFYNKTKIKPTYEYILLKDVNDSSQDAHDLIDFCKKTPSKVNLIEYNKVPNAPYEKSTKKATESFINILENNNILVKLRRSRGEDIGAACGQLATQNNK